MVTPNYDTPVLKVPRIDLLPRVVSHDRFHSMNNKSVSPNSRLLKGRQREGRNILQKIQNLESKSYSNFQRERKPSKSKDQDEKKKKQGLNKNFILKNIEAVGISLKSPKHLHKKSLSSSTLEEIKILNPEIYEDNYQIRIPLHQLEAIEPGRSEAPNIINRNYANSTIKMQISPPQRYSPLKSDNSQKVERPQLPKVSKVVEYSPKHPSVLLQKTIRA